MSVRSHWTIYRDVGVGDGYPWHFQHAHDEADPHFAQDHDYGSLATFEEAVAAVTAASWLACGLALDQVAFYGMELGIDTPDGMRTCALDVAGFHYLETAVGYAETLRGLPAETVADRAERHGYMVSPMDADDDAMRLPLAGATVYRYDPNVGTTWNHDLLSWETVTGPTVS